MTARAWTGHARMAVKQWTRASRVSVSVQPDTSENTAKQVFYIFSFAKAHSLHRCWNIRLTFRLLHVYSSNVE